MNCTIKKNCLFLLFIIISCKMNAQDSSEDTKTVKSYWKADLNYLNNLVYLGRADSLTTPYLTPSIAYYHKSGLYASAAVSYITAKPYRGIDLYTLDLGYEFAINEIFSGVIYGEKYFYNKTSNSIKSDISGMLDATIQADLGLLKFTAEAGLTFANKNDYNASIGLEHLFESPSKMKGLSFNPSVNFYFNTLNFYEGYSNKRITKKQLANNPNFLSIGSTTTASKQGFCFMDWEISLPISYNYNQLTFFATPYFYFPQNQISTTTNATIKLRNGGELKQVFDSTPWSERNLKNGFYLEIGVSFHF